MSKINDSQNNGLIVKIWGPHLWEGLNSIAFGYPVSPTEQQKEEYLTFYKYVGFVMPCVYCRNSYQYFIQCGDTTLSLDVMKSRDSLCKWIFRLREAVNNKLGVDYGMTFEDFVVKYESYRAKCMSNMEGCVVPLDFKAQSYKHGLDRRANLIDSEMVECFFSYAKKRGIDIETEFKKYKNSSYEKDFELWDQRNKICWELINKMRLEGIPSIEESGEFKDLPTVQELKLMSYRCSNLSRFDLNKILEKFGYTVTTVYKLSDKLLKFD